MAITKMKRFTLLSFRGQQEDLVKALQCFGDVHFRDLSKEDHDFLANQTVPDRILRLEGRLGTVNATLKVLAPHAPKKPMTAKRPTLAFGAFDRYLEEYDDQAICGKVKEAEDRLAAIKSENARLKAEIDGLCQWIGLDISPADLERLEMVRPLVGMVNAKAADGFAQTLGEQFPNLYSEVLGRRKDDLALLLLIPAEDYDAALAFLKDSGFTKAALPFTDIPARLIAAHRARITDLEQEKEALVESIKTLGVEHEKLLITKDCLNTCLARERARERFSLSDRLTVMGGWYPEEEEESFLEAVREICGEDYYLEAESVEKDSPTVPIKLKNNAFSAAFEGITAMYSMPLYNEFDPTPILAPFYWCFLGLMVGDMGYGLLLLAGTLFALRRLDLKEGTRRMFKMFFYCSFSVILAGVLYGSFFGMGLGILKLSRGPDGMPKAILDSQMDITLMLILSIAVGIFHVIFGLVVKMGVKLKNSDPWGALFDGGFWIVALLSGIALLLSAMKVLPPSLSQSFGWVFGLSLLALAATQGRDSPTLGGKIGSGLYAVYGITSYVGDFVSYTRIVALALSGAYIGFSFNLMIGLLPVGIPRILGMVVIGTLGHLLNIGLGLLGAYVHTSRLQYVEFFGKFYSGGGVPFSPLRVQNEAVHIDEPNGGK